METKTCSCCRQSKPLSDFRKEAAKRDGHQNYCRDCSNQKRREAYPAQKLARYLTKVHAMLDD